MLLRTQLVSFILLFLAGYLPLPAREIPVYLLQIGRSGEDRAIVVDKKSQELHLYRGSPDGPVLQKKYRCTTGKNNNGTKVREGDNKTPNGIYFFRSVLEDEQLLPQYGVRAFPMDYPNDFDRLAHKTGSGIWLHAVDEDKRVESSYDTKGCVVVTNNDILELSDHIKLGATPIIVDDSILAAAPGEIERQRKRVLEFVNNWAEAWENKEIDRYMDCYDERFRSYGRTKAQQRSHKERLNRIYKTIDVTLSDIRIYAYHDYVVVSFIQEYRSDRFYSKGSKKLYLARSGDALKIIAERMNR